MERKFLKGPIVLGLVGALFVSPSAVAIWQNSKFKDIGEGCSVREVGNQRQFYIGLSRLAIDENKDGSLDRILRNTPVSPMMGGPGYRLMETETTAEDRERFERANYLLNQAK